MCGDSSGILVEDQESRFYRVNGSIALGTGLDSRSRAVVILLGGTLSVETRLAGARSTMRSRECSDHHSGWRCSPRPSGQAIMDELQEPRVLVAVHRHHFDQQTLQARTDVLVPVRQIAQVVRPCVLFLDERVCCIHK